jgi:hypothetical protein
LWAVAKKLIGDKEPEMFQDMALVKPPRLGREKPWHQDHAYFDYPLGMPVLGVWIALDAATIENGCMQLLPGRHREGPITHFQRRDWQICDNVIMGTKSVAAPLPPGGLLLFDGLLPHGTPHNSSANRRRALQFHYAPAGSEQPLAVVLTPGPYNETYFEHSFLARFLGFPLVEGGDLVVRDCKVWLKTLEGLQRVHTILRRQDDSFCDPLELRADSALGVPGMMECADRGTVMIANALGSGVLESGALLGYLPKLCEALHGAPLRLPSIATWWCGEPAAQAEALRNIDHLVFKTADPGRPFEPVIGQELSSSEREAFIARVRAEPERFVAQELVRVSQAPTLTPRRPDLVGTRPIGLRVFAIATPDGYQVMPGGLTRVAADADPHVVSMQRGGSAKDTWILAGSAAPALPPVPVTPELPSVAATRRHVIIASRVVENLFWYGRYAERCDHLARLLRTGLNAALEHLPEGLWRRLLCALKREEHGLPGQPSVLAVIVAYAADRIGVIPQVTPAVAVKIISVAAITAGQELRYAQRTGVGTFIA